MPIIKIDVMVPFKWCEGCKNFEIDTEKFFCEDGVYASSRTCVNSEICRNAFEQKARFYNVNIKVPDRYGEEG